MFFHRIWQQLHRTTRILLVIALFLAAGIIFAATNSYSSSPSAAIPDATGGSDACTGNTPGVVTDTVNVTSGGTITSVTVTLNITHTFASDIVARITSPAGTTVTLIDVIGGVANTCSCGNNDFSLTLSDGAGTAVENSCGSQAGGGTFSPNGSLSSFNGQNPDGTWTLTIEDDNVLDTGTLDSWTLTITTADGTTTATVDVDMDEAPQRIFFDGRINDFDTGNSVVLYGEPDEDDNWRLEVYNADESGLLLVVPAEAIAAVPECPTENTLIYRDDTTNISLWRLPERTVTREGYHVCPFQLNAPSTETGKTYWIIFDTLYENTYYESEDEWIGGR